MLIVSLGGLSSNRVDVAVDGEEGKKDDDIGQDIRGEGTPRHIISEGDRQGERRPKEESRI